MQAALAISRHILLFFVIVIILILTVLLPRDVEIGAEGKPQTVVFEYEFTWALYSENLTGFFLDIIREKSFGLTKYERSAEDEAVLYFSRSLKVIVFAFFLSLSLGILKGIYDAKRGGPLRLVFGKGFTWLLQSVPDFFLFLSLQWILLIYFRDYVDLFGYESWYSFIYPALLVSIYPALYISRITAASILDQEGMPYIAVARSKGLPSAMITFKHMLKNSLVPILTNMGSLMIYLLSNLLIVEYLTDYKGAAYRLFEAFHVTPVLSAGLNTAIEPNVIILFGICFMFMVLTVQILSETAKRWIDPREGSA
ncbi:MULTISPECIES: ABC transporter permease subunit [Metabacillus]|uniref:ABC transmembrane type-1 domain-containing protein n=1 Tax=Metabacillus indicus TaxID=246786 RepID=A0A084GXE6_METID|nr:MULTISPECIES: ABC transporter permease subunit [Metabacillus]KEZ48617.1 hypothetical protein AZ46_0217080 [Metabacillus indicus LMG 22858]KEZ52008.1 hypothetical protein GS18_0213005 [Metabacillus indicus]